MIIKAKKLKQEIDLPWKYILNLYFRQFMEYCWPSRFKEINWTKPTKFLDKELIKITKDAVVGNKIVDKLVEVELINGNCCYILIHLEIQATKQADFSQRMFIYRCRLRDLYNQPIASMAILLDNDPYWRPSSYREILWDSEINMKFPIIKLIDYDKQIKELESSTNPFAIVILAQLTAFKKQANELKLANKVQITRKLYTLGFNKKEVLALFCFIDWIIVLPKESEEEYMRKVAKIEKEEFNKGFMCPAEQLWFEQTMKQGIAQGIEQGMKQSNKKIIQIVRNMLANKLSINKIVNITGVSIEEIKKIKNK